MQTKQFDFLIFEINILQLSVQLLFRCVYIAILLYSKTSEQRTHWGWAICPL